MMLHWKISPSLPKSDKDLKWCCKLPSDTAGMHQFVGQQTMLTKTATDISETLLSLDYLFFFFFVVFLNQVSNSFIRDKPLYAIKVPN
jgi:hypothetical protein